MTCLRTTGIDLSQLPGPSSKSRCQKPPKEGPFCSTSLWWLQGSLGLWLHHPNLCRFCLCVPSFVSLWGAPSVSRPRAGPQSPSSPLVLHSWVRSLPGPVAPCRGTAFCPFSLRSQSPPRWHQGDQAAQGAEASDRGGVCTVPRCQQAPSLARGGFTCPRPGVQGCASLRNGPVLSTPSLLRPSVLSQDWLRAPPGLCMCVCACHVTLDAHPQLPAKGLPSEFTTTSSHPDWESPAPPSSADVTPPISSPFLPERDPSGTVRSTSSPLRRGVWGCQGFARRADLEGLHPGVSEVPSGMGQGCKR